MSRVILRVSDGDKVLGFSQKSDSEGYFLIGGGYVGVLAGQKIDDAHEMNHPWCMHGGYAIIDYSPNGFLFPQILDVKAMPDGRLWVDNPPSDRGRSRAIILDPKYRVSKVSEVQEMIENLIIHKTKQ